MLNLLSVTFRCIPADTVYAAQMGVGDERWEG